MTQILLREIIFVSFFASRLQVREIIGNFLRRYTETRCLSIGLPLSPLSGWKGRTDLCEPLAGRAPRVLRR